MNTDQITIPVDIRGFLENLLKEAGITALDNIAHENMLRDLFARLDNFIATVIAEEMPTEKIEAFIKLNDEQSSQQEIEKYLKDNLPNAQTTMTNAFRQFRELYLREKQKQT